MKLAIQLVTWNGEKWLPGLFESLKKQNMATINWELFVLDNGSKDGTVDFLRKELPMLGIPYELIESSENTGFAGGHNRLFSKTREVEYVCIINQDLRFEPGCIQKLVTFLDAHTEVAVVAPRLMRLGSTGIIDSLGLKKYRSWRVVDSEAGEVWSSYGRSFDSQDSIPVFGVSGACAMFRRFVLDAVSFPDGAIFDESYGSYKEDVDLAFRFSARRQSQTSHVLLDSIAYHARGSGNGKKDQSFFIRYHSYRNHLATLYKNFSLRYILDIPFIVCYEIGKFLWYLCSNPKVLLAWVELWNVRSLLKKKRVWIQKLTSDNV